MDVQHIAAVAGVISLAAAAQSAVGFGYALFAVPLLLYTGMPLPSAITLVATCALIQSGIGVRSLRADVPWRLSLIATATRVTSVILGLILLKKLAGMGPGQIRAVVGGILCVVVAVQVLWRPHPMKSMHWGWAGLAFTASGFLGGVCGMGGPPLVLWSMAHDWSSQRTRGFLFAVFVTSIPVQIVLLGVTFGPSILRNVLLGIACLPAVGLGTAVGLPLGNRMEKSRLRVIAYLILFLIGISALLPALVAP